MDPAMSAPLPTPTGAPVRLRNLTPVVVTGSDGPTLAAALVELFAGGDESVLVSITRVADYEVLVVYSE